MRREFNQPTPFNANSDISLFSIYIFIAVYAWKMAINVLFNKTFIPVNTTLKSYHSGKFLSIYKAWLQKKTPPHKMRKRLLNRKSLIT